MKLFLLSWLIIHFIIGDAPPVPVLLPVQETQGAGGSRWKPLSSHTSPELRGHRGSSKPAASGQGPIAPGRGNHRRLGAGRSVRGAKSHLHTTPGLGCPAQHYPPSQPRPWGRWGGTARHRPAPRPAPPARRSCALPPPSRALASRPLAQGREAHTARVYPSLRSLQASDDTLSYTIKDFFLFYNDS